MKIAIVLMQGLRVDVLPVVNAGQVIGMITAQQVLGVDEQTPVSEIMNTDVLLLDANTSVRQAASAMAERGCDMAFVVEGTLLGTVRAVELISVISQSYDPLTQLPWQDALRNWSIHKLSQGHEISILFFDIDRFGQFNKQYDHVTGDRVLEQVARTIEREIDQDLCFLCRYGGDEFAVSTLYMSEEAHQLAARIARRIEDILIPKVQETITVSYGIFGGRRTREREIAHYAATVDDLITRASRMCTQMKQRKGTLLVFQPSLFEVEAPERVEARVQAAGFSFVAHQNEAEAIVELAFGEQRAVGHVRSSTKKAPEELMALATLHALQSLIPGISAQIHHVTRTPYKEELEGVTVIIGVTKNSGEQLLTGSALIRESVQRAAINAVLHALNRLLTKMLPSLPGKRPAT